MTLSVTDKADGSGAIKFDTKTPGASGQFKIDKKKLPAKLQGIATLYLVATDKLGHKAIVMFSTLPPVAAP